MTIILHSIEYELRELSAKQVLDCINSANALCEDLSADNEISELACTLAEYGLLAQSCLYQGSQPAFSSPREVLSVLSIDELCDIYDAYQRIGGEH